MKLDIQLICNDIDLYNTFNGSGFFNSVKIGGVLDLNASYANLILSDRIVGYSDLLNYLNSNQLKASKIFYLLSYTHNESHISSIMVVLKAKNIIVVPPRLTDKQILDRICQALAIDKMANRNAIAFFGADSKVGTTITAQGAAECLAENTVLKVGLLNLSGQPSFNYMQGSDGYGLDIIKTKIFNFVLSSDELKSAMIQRGGLYVLPSAKTLTDLRFYKPKHIEYLINLATGLFDIVVVDAGYYPNSGLYIGALNATQLRYMVATQQVACRAAFDMTKEQLFKVQDIDTGSMMLVINRYSEEFNLPSTYKLAEEFYKMILAAYLPNVPGVFWKTESEKRSLRGFDTFYDAQLHELVRVIATQLNIDYLPRAVPNKKRFLSSFHSLFNLGTKQ